MRLPNGYGSVRKLSGKRRRPWMVQKTAGFEIDPATEKVKQKMITIGYYVTRREALEALAEYNAKPWDPAARNLTFSDVYKKWAAKKYTEVSESSIKAYSAAWKALAPIHDIPMRDLKAEPIQKIVDGLDKSRAHLSNIKTIASACFNYCIQNDICEKNYADFVTINPKAVQIKREPFTDEQVARLWDLSNAGDSMAADVLLILLYTGMRVGELLDMPTECVDLEKWTLDIRHSKTDAGIRCVPVHSKVRPIVARYAKQGGPYLIKDGKRDHITYAMINAYRLPAIWEAIGAEHHLHDTRHTFVSKAKEQNVDPLYLKILVGHARQGVTDSIYTHVKPEILAAEIEKICYMLDT